MNGRVYKKEKKKMRVYVDKNEVHQSWAEFEVFVDKVKT